MTSQLQLFASNMRSAQRLILAADAEHRRMLESKESDVLAAIKSFVPGSASGPDGLRPQHLQDQISVSSGDAGHCLLTRLTEFTNLCLKGRVPAVVQPVFCGASLCALNKKDGDIRPIAVCCLLRLLIAQAACKTVLMKKIAS
jgi:hypothetical protein